MTATPERQLAGVLRSLHLTGMLDTLEIRLAEARSGKLGHVEFLQVLMEDELARRDAAGVQRRIRAAGFPTEATLEAFDFNYNKALPASTIRDLARLEFIQAGEGLLLYGPVGVGKSHIACALGHLACRRGYEVRFTTCSKLLEPAWESWRLHTLEARMESWTRTRRRSGTRRS